MSSRSRFQTVALSISALTWAACGFNPPGAVGGLDSGVDSPGVDGLFTQDSATDGPAIDSSIVDGPNQSDAPHADAMIDAPHVDAMIDAAPMIDAPRPDAMVDAPPMIDAMIDAPPMIDAPMVDAPPAVVTTAFRMTDLDLRDPHLTVAGALGSLTCNDITEAGVNAPFQTQITTDGNSDGFFDFSPVIVFRPLSQTAATGTVELNFAQCTTGANPTCSSGPTSRTTPVAYTVQTSGTCLAPVANTTNLGYFPAVTSTGAPCFASEVVDQVNVMLGGQSVPLHAVRYAGKFNATPATGLQNGLVRGFLTEADADAIVFTTGPLAMRSLSSLLAGGTDACPLFSDQDTLGGVTGWWMYLNFPASAVGWTD